MITTAWDILEDTDLRWVCGSYLRQSWNVVMASSLQRVEKKSKWLSCVMQWERRSVELDVPMAEHNANVWIPIELGASSWDKDEDNVLASSEQRVEMMNSRWLFYVMQWKRRFVEWTCLWMSIGEHDPSDWALVSVALLWDSVRYRYGHPCGCGPIGWALVGVWDPLLYCSRVILTCNPNYHGKGIGWPHLNVKYN